MNDLGVLLESFEVRADSSYFLLIIRASVAHLIKKLINIVLLSGKT